MKTKIESDKELKEVIEQMGALQAEIEAKKAEVAVLKPAIEVYMAQAGLKKVESKNYLAKLAKGKPALVIDKTETHASMAEKLEQNGLGEYVCLDFNSDKIKPVLVAGKDEKLCDAFKEIGFNLTSPKGRLVVEPKE